MAQRGRRCRVAVSKLGDLALGLFLLALQLGGEVRCPLFRAGGALAQGGQLDLSLLLLARPSVRRVSVRGLLILQRLLSRVPNGASCIRFSNAGFCSMSSSVLA